METSAQESMSDLQPQVLDPLAISFMFTFNLCLLRCKLVQVFWLKLVKLQNSRLKNLRAEWRRAYSTTRQAAMSLIENLNADIKLLKECLKKLMCKVKCFESMLSPVAFF